MGHPRDKYFVEPLSEKAVLKTEQVVATDRASICPGIGDRDFWGKIGLVEQAAVLLDKAGRLCAEDLPVISDEMFLDFSKTGNRERYQTVLRSRRERLMPLTIAECLENQGRFIPTLEHVIREQCKEQTWLLPAHDPKLGNFKGEWVDVDLASAMLGLNLATIWQLLSSRLSDETKTLIEENIRWRILDPYRLMISSERTYNWWLTHDSNWNSVCLTGVTGCGVMMEESRHSRAFFITAAEKYSWNYIDGFNDDGYCSEGIGYWNYGFTNYLVLAHLINRATNHAIDLYRRPHIQAIAESGTKLEIINSVYPSFSDCNLRIIPSPVILEFFARRGADIPEQPIDAYTTKLFESQLYEFTTFSKLLTDPPDSPAATTKHINALRSQFENNDVVICRPGTDSSCIMGLALKAGHNDEMHNHNDVGSYVVVVNDEPVLLDPGNEVYTRRTFSPRRYESRILNSYAHPVPVVAGALQPDGKDANGRIAGTDFSDDCDTIILDLLGAYTVPSLVELHRTFEYSRKRTGVITITDAVTFSTPEQFETALTTMGNVEQIDDTRLHIRSGKEAVEACIDTSGTNWEICPERINADMSIAGEPTRIAIRLVEPVIEATVKVTIRQLPD
jgi:hypothetical protein